MTVREITKRIGSIKFSCLSPEEIRKMSATKIITADTYDDEGYPIEMGLMDSHIGVIEPARAIRGKAIDLDDLFAEVLGDMNDGLQKKQC